MNKDLPTWQHRFDIEFSNRWFAPWSKEQYLAFIEQEILEAERRMKERCLDRLEKRKKILKRDFHEYDAKQVQYMIKAISSLK